MKAERSSASYPPATRVVSWLVTAILVGWFIVYNAFRLTGSSPRGAAFVSLGIGAALGLVLFGLTLASWRRYVATGRVHLHRSGEVAPLPGEIDESQRSLLTLSAVLVGALAVVSLVIGVVLGLDWLRTAAADRSSTKLILAIWDVVAGVWLATEAPRLRALQADALDSIGLACLLTAVLGGVALSRSMIAPGQVLLIVLAGATGAVTGLAAWALAGRRGLPIGAVTALAVAVLAIVLPLVV